MPADDVVKRLRRQKSGIVMGAGRREIVEAVEHAGAAVVI